MALEGEKLVIVVDLWRCRFWVLEKLASTSCDGANESECMERSLIRVFVTTGLKFRVNI